MNVTALSTKRATEINQLHGELNSLARTTLDKAVRIGELLTDQKKECGHGKWLPWLEGNVEFDRRTATNYMRIYGERDKWETISHLTDAYRLLAASNGSDEPELELESEPEEEGPQFPSPTEPISLEMWQGLDKASKEYLLTVGSDWRSTFNDTNENIEWARYSWNPVTGCLHNCDYCYARDLTVRFKDTYPHGFAPAFIPSRLVAPIQTAQRAIVDDESAKAVDRMGYRNVFVCSMADLFGKWVPTEWIQAVLDQVTKAEKWNFLFLTKFPVRMAEFSFPANAWVGTTVDRQSAVDRAEKAFRQINAGVKWLSCEPMMERLTFTSLKMFDWAVIGGATRSTQTPEFFPEREWINHLEDQARKAGVPVYEKTNLLQRIREYPCRQT